MPHVKVTREDWLRAALDALAADGVRGVAVEPIAKRLGVSRGSFYWYFKDRAALLSGALELWERQLTDQFIADVAPIADPRERLEALVRNALTREPFAGLEPAIVAHADDPIVKDVLERVTERRMDYLTDLYTECGLREADARRQAVVAYAVYLGWKELRRAAPAIAPETAPSSEGVSGAAIGHLLAVLAPAHVDNGNTDLAP
ncbi:TetR/AcrR family transcriptional regulator [Glycomyces sp. TRM65418]|uniref:TetR/AcrR family transcriptional regulator n=1 Tax=Glycomyces sp. TRM65418 TaxID=2867006 RepID=UPI001CE51E5A|nr:TetR/AcrR family transcriptional regulator [Glycomyces sp. TRM65418]MCC3765928.1 TetR/AcrR family transcriptional regulator [Glycomyces sp. TRM65418]QZD55510.1 TetR/AcrR family transcriptional regulator [Glycomyces sp. TRM65418]